MSTRPEYHWQFKERDGTTTIDAISGAKATLADATWEGHGRIGPAIRIRGRASRPWIEFSEGIGQFGTSDFTIAFGMKINGTFGQKDLDVIGNRRVGGHGNWVSVRMRNQGQLSIEVDENSKGKNYAVARSNQKLKDGKWHHVAVVRDGRSLTLYIDGAVSAEGTSRGGVANIQNNRLMRLGHSHRGSAIAQYEDLRIYHTALDASEVRALIPPANRHLNEGQIELIGADQAAVILSQNSADLRRFSGSFHKLRLGRNTGVTLYQQVGFQGKAQKCYAPLPDIRHSRLGEFPKSIRIWPAAEEPFTGKWIIKAPNGQFLSLGTDSLTTATGRTLSELFRFYPNLDNGLLQLLPHSDRENAQFIVSKGQEHAYLFIDELTNQKDAFFIVNTDKNQWLKLSENNTFDWTTEDSERAFFVCVAKLADHEGQVGALDQGEVAFYEHRAYHGKTWILSDHGNDLSGNFTRFSDFEGLDNQTSSIRLGPNTGVTLFAQEGFSATNGNRETEIEDITADVPDLLESQVGDDTISSIKIFKAVSPEEVFTSFSSKLSQDYHMVGNQLEEFSAYRTILRLEPDVKQVEVSATDLTEIEVEGVTHQIDEVRSVTLSPNEMNLIMITSEADGINTPGLKIRTEEMAPNERVLIYPNQEAQKQIAELEADALWNAKDAKGNFIVDRKAHSQAEVASVQNTIKRTMASVMYADEPALTGNSNFQSKERTISGDAVGDPWVLNFSDEASRPEPGKRNAQARTGSPLVKSLSSNRGIHEQAITQEEFMQFLQEATPANVEINAANDFSAIQGIGTARSLRIGGLFKKIGSALKKATSVVIGVAKKALHIIVRTATGVFDFILDTVEKVGEFIEAVVLKVVESVKKFIEFLQFLFNWGDILDTQRYFARVINSGLDTASESATQFISSLKPHVSSFVDGLQEGVEDGMNELVTVLGGEPSEVRSGKGLPEALEWFLSKLLGGSKSPGASMQSFAGIDIDGESGLERFFAQLLDILENAVGSGTRIFEGVAESIEAFLENPKKPQFALIAIIESFRDAIIQLLDSAEGLAIGLLDAIVEIIKLIRNQFSKELKIPFISQLFELLGAGKLTIVNLSSLLIAIPATITSKIATGKNVFKKAALPRALAANTRATRSFSTPSAASLVVGGNLVVEQRQTEEQAEDPLLEVVTSIAVTMADTIGHVLSVILDSVDVAIDIATGGEGLEGSSSDGPISVLEALEGLTVLLNGISLVFSAPSSEGKERRREDILYTYRTTRLMIDVATLLAGHKVAAEGQRMRRLNEFTVGGWCLFSIVDLGLFSWYIASVEDENKRVKRTTISGEVFASIPDVFAFLKLGLEAGKINKATIIAALAHIATNVVAAGTTIITGGILIGEAAKEL